MDFPGAIAALHLRVGEQASCEQPGGGGVVLAERVERVQGIADELTRGQCSERYPGSGPTW